MLLDRRTLTMLTLDWLRQDIRTAIRALHRTPNVTAAAVITLALGIGATTTIYSLFQAVLLRRLPVASPDELYFVTHGGSGGMGTSSHYPWFEQVAAHSDLFSGVTAYSMRDLKVSAGVDIEGVVGQYVSGNFHAVIGAPFQLGRGFSAEDDRTAKAIAVISDGYWARRFGRAPDVLGKTLNVGMHRVSIVGVTAPAFNGMQPGRSIELTLPLSLRIQDDPEFLTRTDTWTSMPLVVRLRRGVDHAKAETVVASTFGAYMALPMNRDFSRTPSGELQAARLQPAARGSDRLREEYTTPLRVLMSMVAVVLLIACVNVANLLLTRAPARAREVAVRMSVGASRSRIARQLVTESVVLSLCGGALGLLFSFWGTELVSSLFRTGMRPIVLDVQPDGGVLVFATILSVLTGVAFGLAPAWKAIGIDLAVTLKAGSTLWGTARRRWGQQALVAGQIALCLVLVFGAALLARTLQNLRGVNAGFDKDALVLFELDARDTSFPPERLEALCGDVISRLTARPEARSGACSTMSPIATNTEGRVISVPGFTPGPGDPPFVFANSVGPGYFETLGIELVRGRTFNDRDTAASARVGVLSEVMARHYFGDTDPIGRSFSFGRSRPGPPITIVGVVRNARQQLREPTTHMAYTPLSQRQEPPNGLLAAVRTADESSAIAAAVRDEVRGLSRDVAVTYVRTMNDQIGAALVGERLLALLSSAFAILALVLACIGLYGVMSYEVAVRAREIGIRLALGAQRTHVLGRVLRHAAIVTMLGVGLGAAGATAASRTVSSFLFGLAPNDVTTFGLATLVLMATALMSSYFPARRASRVDPVEALRAE